MKLFFIFFFLFITEFSFPQTILNGSVKDINSLEPLPYCSIAIKGTKKNAITNEEGSFSLSVNLRKDTILFSYVGYDIAIVPATDLIRNKTIFLKSKQVLLKEFTLHATSDYLYDILIKCRKKILSDQTKRIAKVYYGIETQAKDQPIEQVECYYNGYRIAKTMGWHFVEKGDGETLA